MAKVGMLAGSGARSRRGDRSAAPWIATAVPRSLSGSLPSDLRGRADEDLIRLVNDGEVRAFEVIFDRHSGIAYSFAYRICGRRAIAEDAVQEAFLSLWRNGARYDRTRGSVRSWMLSVVHNRAIDALRRMAVTESHTARDQQIAESRAAPELTEAEVVRRADARQVRQALEELPPEQRHVIELAFFSGFTHRQIAEMLRLPAGTVKGRIRLGLVKLRAVLASTATVI